MSEAPAVRLAAAIHELVRTHTAAAPPPRGLAYLGLEHTSGTGFHLLDALAARGIFRKYELVLDVGAGLGASSRWLAGRLGCVAVGTTSAAEARAGRELTRRAGLAAQVRFVPADAQALPFRVAHFTHVWILEALPRMADPEAALHEAFRVLRRGGSVAVQDLVLAEAGADPCVPGWRPDTAAARREALARAGFTDLEVRDRTPEAAEHSAQIVAAREQLARRLRTDPALAPMAAEREALARALGTGTLRVVQLLGRRP